MKLCGEVDPFCSGACGCQMMDGNSSRVFTYTSKSAFAVQVDASGNGVKYFTPGIQRVAVGASAVTAGGAVTWGTPADLPDFTGLEDLVDSYRVVSAGLRIYSNVASDDAAGRVIVAAISTPNGGVLAAADFNLLSLQYEEVTTDSVYAFDKKFIFRQTGTDARAFQPMATATAKVGWNSLVVGVAGGAASVSPLICELTVHYEFQPVPITVLARLAKQPVIAPPKITSLVQTSQNKLEMSYPGDSASTSIYGVVKQQVVSFLQGVDTADLIAMMAALFL